MTPAYDNCRKHFACGVLLVCLAFAGCNRMATPPAKQILKDADAKAAAGDFLPALNLYERSLDGTPASAEVHYKMALLYDDKMSDPLNALHHFKRYLTLTPTGPHANEVKAFMKRDELAVATSLSGDVVITRAEAANLRNENLKLRQQINEQATQAKAAAANEKSSHRATKSNSSAKRKSSRHSRVVKNQ